MSPVFQSATRTVDRVTCRAFNLVIIESIESCTGGEQYAFKHSVMMWTPASMQTTLELEEEQHVHYS